MDNSRTIARRRRRGVVLFVVGGAAALLIGWIANFLLLGGHVYVVRTPSMGTVAPVGTLVLTEPTTVEQLHVGDVIAFHPPTSPSETFTHRVVAIDHGVVRTRGDINGARDPWSLRDRDLIGRATTIVPGAGWALRASPYLIAGALLVWALTGLWVSEARRGPARMFGAAVVVLVTVQVLSPLVGVAQLASTSAAGTTVTRVSAVSTGLLPVRLTPAPGSGHAAAMDLQQAGDTGIATLSGVRAGARYQLDVALHLSPTQWLIAGLVCASPLLWTLLVGYRRPDEQVSGPAALAVPA